MTPNINCQVLPIIIVYSPIADMTIKLPESAKKVEHLIEELSNSKDGTLLNFMNKYPILSTKAHKSPFDNRWLNLPAGLIFPIGVFFYFRIWAFRIRLNKDMERIIKTNEDVIGIIERDQNK